ncbi:uncharacterized protein V1510DRAFT_415390 [Dipodascopsis tothii]|uniref:uncharacterized protein n=1 Tax=Dipodascopsis tothii TaxID=44089 RepID=UPI0034CD209D
MHSPVAVDGDFRRQACALSPKVQPSLLSQMLTSPLPTELSAAETSDYSSQSTTPAPGRHGIIRLPSDRSSDSSESERPARCRVVAAVVALASQAPKRCLKFACDNSKREEYGPAAAGALSDSGLDVEDLHHPVPRRMLRVDDVLVKEREISRLGDEAAREEAAEDEDDENDDVVDDEDDEDDDDDDDDDDADEPDAEPDEDDDVSDLEPTLPGRPFLHGRSPVPSFRRSSPALRRRRSPVPRVDIDDGYASDDDSGDSDDEVGNPYDFLVDKRHRDLDVAKTAAGTATPPLDMVPNPFDFVCGTFDEDRPVQMAYMSALEERRSPLHCAAPQEIDPSFPEECDDESEGSDASEASRRPRSPPPVHHRRSPSVSRPISNRRQRSPGLQIGANKRNNVAVSYQHARPTLDAKSRRCPNFGIPKADREGRARGAIDIVKGLESKNNRRQENRRRQHEIAPGEGVEKMRQLGMVALRRIENPYSEWMLSV